ncbi:MAG: T9SS type B sorting domain-containing protein, partial [Flavobacteriaceae bacterium]|nr:T9SS type B sorting domain-containing protein [Flavobacteriaceae bacterium]
PTYHLTQADADNNVNAIATPNAFANTVANNQTIFVRLEDSVNGCVNTAQLNLVVVPVPNLNTYTLVQCEVDAVIDGLALFTLSEANASLITVGVETDYIFSYHLTQADADGFVNPLPNNYNNIVPNQIVFARVQENATGCYNVTQVTLNAVSNAVPAAVLNLCDNDGNGTEDFILSNANAQIIPSIPAAAIITYYFSEFDAQQEINPLPNAYTSIAAVQVIYYRVEDGNDCYGIGTLTLNSNPLPLVTAITPFNMCSDDGVSAIFDFTSKEAEILNGQTGMTVSYYPTLADATAGMNAHPVVYGNVANPETVFVRIEDDITGCFSTTSFELNVNQNPSVVNPTPLNLCDVNNTGDMIEDFDLTVKNNEISGGDTNLAVTYYPTQVDADNEINEITGLYTNAANPDVVFVRVEDLTTLCYTTTTLELNVLPLPVANTPTDLYACDVDNNGITAFNLTSKDLEITGANPNLTVSYHETDTDAEQDLNALASPYTNINFPFLQPIYARVVDITTGCFVVVTFNLVALDSPQLDINITPLALCDTDQDGFAIFDLTSKVTEILNGQPNTMPVTFYEIQANADAGINPIGAPNAYPNVTNPQTIFFRIENPDDGDPNTPTCFVVGQFDLIVNLPPVLQSPVPSIEVCDDDYYVLVTQVPRFTFDLTQNEAFILNGLTGISFTYFDDDTNTQVADPTAWENITNADTIRVEATDGNGCTSIVFFDVRVLPNPTPLQPFETPNLLVCEGDGDEFSVFDLATNEALITGGDPDVTVSYHETFDDANAYPGLNPIGNPNNYTNITNPQSIFVRVTNTTSGCYTITSFTIFVPLPQFDLGADQILCLDAFGNLLNGPVLIDTGLPNNGTYTFAWELDSQPLAENGPAISATQTGTYMVTVTGADPLCFTSDTIQIIGSTPALTLDLEVTTEFFATDDHIIVATVTGSGDYEYSLNGGPYQDSNVFTNVDIGLHTVTVRDKNGCGEISDTVAVIGYKKFFTPNGDGYNETWQIVGAEGLPDSEIYIFDRYGKLLKQLNPTSIGWDGTYNGSAMPSTDYWFKILYSQNGQSKEFGAHFSLKR